MFLYYLILLVLPTSCTEMSSVISILSRKATLITQLQHILPGLTFHQVTNPDTDEQLKRSDIIIADFDLLGPRVYELPNVKWVQGTWAGAETLLKHVRPDRPPHFPVTRFSGKHFGTLMGEYVVGNIINFERDFLRIKTNQDKAEWNHDGKVFEHRTIPELSVGIMGLGTIGSKIGATLRYLGAEVVGLGRNATVDPMRHPYVSKYFSVDQLPEFLSHPDYIVNVLPDTPESRGMLNGKVLENCQGKQSVLINIGRGTIISEDALVEALEKKWLGGAILDVFMEEPLPKGSRLWTIPNVIITPHIAGVSRVKDIAEQFKENLELYKANASIPATIDFKRGY